MRIFRWVLGLSSWLSIAASQCTFAASTSTVWTCHLAAVGIATNVRQPPEARNSKSTVGSGKGGGDGGGGSCCCCHAAMLLRQNHQEKNQGQHQHQHQPRRRSSSSSTTTASEPRLLQHRQRAAQRVRARGCRRPFHPDEHTDDVVCRILWQGCRLGSSQRDDGLVADSFRIVPATMTPLAAEPGSLR